MRIAQGQFRVPGWCRVQGGLALSLQDQQYLMTGGESWVSLLVNGQGWEK
jgi:hypothetical protein